MLLRGGENAIWRKKIYSTTTTTTTKLIVIVTVPAVYRTSILQIKKKNHRYDRYNGVRWVGTNFSEHRIANVALARAVIRALVQSAVVQFVYCANSPKPKGHRRNAASPAMRDKDKAWERVDSSVATSAANAESPGFTIELPRPQIRMDGSSV